MRIVACEEGVSPGSSPSSASSLRNDECLVPLMYVSSYMNSACSVPLHGRLGLPLAQILK